MKIRDLKQYIEAICGTSSLENLGTNEDALLIKIHGAKSKVDSIIKSSSSFASNAHEQLFYEFVQNAFDANADTLLFNANEDYLVVLNNGTPFISTKDSLNNDIPGELYSFLAKGKSDKEGNSDTLGQYGQGSKLLYTLIANAGIGNSEDKLLHSIKELKKQGTWETQMKLQLLLFTYFAIWICNRINKAYSQLAKQMEYDADDVAIKYVGASTLQRALLHATCIRYNYDVVQWGMQQLQSQNIQVDNLYLALSFVGNYSRPTRRLLSEEVIKRVERLGRLETSNTIATTTVQQSALLLADDNGQTSQQCPALQFAQWLRQGFTIYTQQRLLETSVELEIHLDKRKHKLPYFDGSYKLLLDDKEIGTGNFIKGYTLKRKTSPGKHKLTAYAPSGIISTPFEFEVEQDKSYHIEMDYKLHAKDGIYDVFGERFNEC